MLGKLIGCSVIGIISVAMGYLIFDNSGFHFNNLVIVIGFSVLWNLLYDKLEKE